MFLTFFKKQKLFSKIILGCFIFCCLLGIFLPLKQALAFNIWGFLTDGLTVLPLNIIKVTLGFVSWLIYALMLLAHGILMWVLGNPLPDGLSLTNPAKNPIIDIGWTTLRDFTNMLFILGLAYIGLMTALDLSSFNTKKTFTNLLLIALLINFTPIICGAIVDGSNIIANFFISGVSYDEAKDALKSKMGLDAMLSWDFEKNVSELMNIFGVLIFGLVLMVVFALFALLLLVRIIMLWFLVILSPIAFFAWIFDSSKKYFKMWWDLFIKWATIIVPAGFFLYLSTHVFAQADKLFKTQYPSGGEVDFSFFASITPMLMGCGFAIVGFLATLKINAMGTKSIIGVATKASNKVRTTTKKWTADKARNVGNLAKNATWTRAASGLSNRLQAPQIGTKEFEEWEKEHKVAGALKQARRYALGGKYSEEEIAQGKGKSTIRKVARIAGIPATLGATYWGGRVVESTRSKVAEKARGVATTQIKTSSTETAGKSLETQRRLWQSTLDPVKLVGILDGIQKDGNFGDVVDMDNEKERGKIKKILVRALKQDPETFKKLRYIDVVDKRNEDDSLKRKSLFHEVYEENKDKISLDTLDRAGMKFSVADAALFGKGEDTKGNKIDGGLPKELDSVDETKENGAWEILLRKTIANFKSKDVEFVSKPDLMAMLRSEEFQKFGNQSVVSQAATLFAREAIEAAQAGIDAHPGDYYSEHNKKLHNYYKNTPARNLGIDYPFGETKKTEEKKETASSLEQLEQAKEEYEDLEEQSVQAIAKNDQQNIDALNKQKKDAQKKIDDLEESLKQEQTQLIEEEKRKKEEEQKKEIKEAEDKKEQQEETTQPTNKKPKKRGMGRRRI